MVLQNDEIPGVCRLSHERAIYLDVREIAGIARPRCGQDQQSVCASTSAHVRRSTLCGAGRRRYGRQRFGGPQRSLSNIRI